MARQKCFYYILYYIFITFYYIFDLVSEYIPFVTKKRYHKHTETNKKAKETNEEKRHTYKINQRRKGEKNVVVVSSICRKSNDKSEFAVKVVFHLLICLQESNFFLFKQQKVGLFNFQQRKELLD